MRIPPLWFLENPSMKLNLLSKQSDEYLPFIWYLLFLLNCLFVILYLFFSASATPRMSLVFSRTRATQGMKWMKITRNLKNVNNRLIFNNPFQQLSSPKETGEVYLQRDGVHPRSQFDETNISLLICTTTVLINMQTFARIHSPPWTV